MFTKDVLQNHIRLLWFTDATLPWDNLLLFREILLERIQRVIMTIDDKIRYKKLQYDINRETSKRSALWSGKIDKYKYPTV